MLTLLAASYRDVPLEARERLSVGSDQATELIRRLAAHLGPCTVLNTCNRFELYVTRRVPRERVIDLLVREAGFDRALCETHFRALYDGEAVEHLFAVAAGLDSMVLGESEVLGQVRGAFSHAVEAGADGRVLAHLFHSAVRCGRRARHDTTIGQHALSIASVAVAEVTARVTDLAGTRVLIAGAGEAARQAAEALVDRGVHQISIANRTAARAQALAARLGGTTVPFENLGNAIADADVVVAATGAPLPVIEQRHVACAMQRRPERPLLLVDLAVPRDVDPAVRALPHVTCLDVDELRGLSERNAEARRAEVPRVRAIVEEEAEKFARWWELLDVAPTISALAERADQLRRAQLEKTVRAMHPTAEQREQLDALTRSLVKQILHAPIATLREHGDREQYVHVVRRLFQLDDPAGAASHGASG